MADDNQIFQDKTTGKYWRKSGDRYVPAQAPQAARPKTTGQDIRSGLLERIKSSLIAGPEERGMYLRNRNRPDVPLDSGENPQLGNPTGTKPLARELSTAGQLSNIAAMGMGGESQMGMPKGMPLLGRAGRDVSTIAGEGVEAAGRGASRVGREIVGTGPSMERLQAAKDLNAIPLKQHLSALENTVREDSSTQLERSVRAMDLQHPNGVIPKTKLAPQVDQIISSLVKIPEKEPAPIPAMTEEPPSELSQASVFRGARQTPAPRGSTPVAEAFATQEKLNEFLHQIGETPVEEE